MTVIAAAASSDVSVVNKIVTETATTMDSFNITSAIQTVELDIVQKNIFEFIMASFSDLSETEIFEISVAMATFDTNVIESNNFAAAFATISLSTELTEKMEVFAETANFEAISLVVDVLKTFEAEKVSQEEINNFDLSTITEVEGFWTSEIDASVVVSLVEASSVKSEIITSVLETGIS